MAVRNTTQVHLSVQAFLLLLLSMLAMTTPSAAEVAGQEEVLASGQVEQTQQTSQTTAKGKANVGKQATDRTGASVGAPAGDSADARKDARAGVSAARNEGAVKASDARAARNDEEDDDDDTDEIYSKREDLGALLQTQSAVGQVRVKSWKTLRDTGIVKQDLDYSCGAASAATLLNSFYGQKVSEKAFLKAMGEEDGMASFEDMAKAMPKFGFRAQGFAASWEQLQQLKIPVIVYVKYRKDDHFSVLRGISGDTVWLADPSLGNRTFSKSQFLQMWQTRDDDNAPELAGKLLAVLPAKADISRVEDYFSKTPRRQSASAVAQLEFRGTR